MDGIESFSSENKTQIPIKIQIFEIFYRNSNFRKFLKKTRVIENFLKKHK